jgi:hypothetical protein
MKDLFKLSVVFDDSAFQRVFRSFEDTLNRHEEMILELQRLLKDRPSRQDLEVLKLDMRSEFDEKLKLLEQRLADRMDARAGLLEKQIQAQLAGLAEIAELRGRLKLVEDTAMENGRTVNARLNLIEDTAAKTGRTVNDRLNLVEDTALKNGRTVNDLYSFVQSIANGYGRINSSVIPLDKGMEKPLNAVADSINSNFKAIFDALAKNQNDIAELLRAAAEEKPVPTLEIDLSNLNPKPPVTRSWQDPPNLPEIAKFETVNDAVAYIYNLLPILQGHLTAIHGRVVDNVHDLSGIMDREALEAFLEKLRRAILEMDNELAELRRGLGRNLTKADVLALLNQALLDRETETAIGSVKCIACGKETRQVSGATIETDSVRRLGVPPNALALLSLVGGGHIGQLYSNQEQMQSAIQEAPRSVRPFRGACKVTRHQNSKPPSKERILE